MKIESLKDNPIFIVGVPRSGTTLLRLILTSHSRICIPPESTFFIDLAEKYDSDNILRNNTKDFIAELYENKKFQEWNIDKSYLEQKLEENQPFSYSECISLIYELYLTKNSSSACIWGDKNPTYIYNIDSIFQYFPQARVIHIVRDLRAVYASLKKISENKLWGENSSNFTIHSVSDMWNKALDISINYKNDKRFCLLKYEDLVSQPQKEINKLCQWLNLDFEREMLSFHQKNVDKNLVPKHRLKWHENTLMPINSNKTDSWRDKLSQIEIEEIEIRNYNKFKQGNYKTVTHFILLRKIVDFFKSHFKRLLSKTYGLKAVKHKIQ